MNSYSGLSTAGNEALHFCKERQAGQTPATPARLCSEDGMLRLALSVIRVIVCCCVVLPLGVD